MAIELRKIRGFLLLLGSISTLAASASAQEGHSLNSADRISQTGRTVPLLDQLKNGLRATRPNQEEFLQHLVAQVDQGAVPRSMVNTVYKWALQRNPRVPFPYFQVAMRELAKRRGVTLL